MIVALVGVLELSSCLRLEGAVGEAVGMQVIECTTTHIFHALVFLDTVNIPMYTGILCHVASKS